MSIPKSSYKPTIESMVEGLNAKIQWNKTFINKKINKNNVKPNRSDISRIIKG